MKWQILWPKNTSKGENDDSIVALLTIQKYTVLLTGDASEKVEDTILMDAPNLHFSILKVGHHGSRTSTSEALLKKLPLLLPWFLAGRIIVIAILQSRR